jgi:hypothetical protein
MNNHIYQIQGAVHLPDGRPAPYVLSLTDAAALIGLRGGRNPGRSIAEYCRNNGVPVRRIGNQGRVLLPHVLLLIEKLWQEAGEENVNQQQPITGRN